MRQALSKGYELTYYPCGPLTTGITRCRKKGKEFFFKSTCTALTPSFGVFAAENKVLTHSLLEANDVQMPQTTVLSAADSIDVAAGMLPRFSPLVVKPSSLNHGDGVSLHISDRVQLERAVDFARKAGGTDSDVLVQQQVAGHEYRFLVLANKVIAVASRRPPSVEGDGVSTVRQLIEQKNADPRRGKGHTKELTLIDLDEVTYHHDAGFLESVPSKGEGVVVLHTSNLSRGGESVDCTDIASPALKKMAVAAAQHCFLGIAGVDIITKDITADTVKGSYIIEVNLAPGLRMHQFPAEGKPRDVAKLIFAAIEKTARPIGKPVTHLGKVEQVDFPDFSAKRIPSRIDTGATVSSVWASHIQETPDGLQFVLFDEGSEWYTGQMYTVGEYGKRAVASSMGHVQVRYQVRTPIVIAGRRILAAVTLADRSTQVYPVLIGRNVLNKKFVVDVATGYAKSDKERIKRAELDDLVKTGEEV